jgi:hypothetical protein
MNYELGSRVLSLSETYLQLRFQYISDRQSHNTEIIVVMSLF